MKPEYQWIEKLIATLPGAEIVYKDAWQAFTFLIGGKIFAILGTSTGENLLTIKGDPARNEELKELYSDIIPGYHVNKTHWISAKLDSPEIPQALLENSLEAAYFLVLGKLPKKVRAQFETEKD